MASIEVADAEGTGKSQITACGLLQRLAARTWGEIRDGDERGIRVGEESITDRLLLDISRSLPLPTKVIKWNRYQEGNFTGADWDWWFVDLGRRQGVGLRIQAKRIEYFSERFDALGHENRLGPQIDLLKKSAAEAGLHPLYCLYLASGKQREGETRCGSYPSHQGPSNWTGSPAELYGCSLAGVVTVEIAILEREENLDFFWPFLLPWSCMLCCERMKGSMLERIDSQVGRMQSFPYDRLPDLPESRITAALPAEVWSVLEGGAVLDDVEPPQVGATMVTLVAEDEG
jgi:hypothetical protein